MSQHPTTAPDPGEVRAAIADGVGTLEFSHPKGNSLPAALLRQLADWVDELSARDEARVVVLRSSGTGPFCAGASFDELKSIRDEEAGKEFFMGFARLILAMKRSPKVIIGRVHGKAVGGGVGVVAASDYAMAAEGASVRLSELAVGIGPFVVGPAISRKIGPGAFTAMAIDADWRDARQAAAMGLYSQVFPTVAELDAGIASLAGRLAASNPVALMKIKKIAWEGTEGWSRLLAERAAMSGELVLSDFTRSAITAFEKRSR